MISFRDCRRDDELAAAHRDEDVQRAAYLMARLRTPALVEEAVVELTRPPGHSAPPTRVWQEKARRMASSPEEEATAYDALQRCSAVALKPDFPGPSRRRGALLELLVAELLLMRPMQPVRQEVRFVFRDGDSECVDVVGVSPAPIEAYECKVNPEWLTQARLNALEEIHYRCDLEGIDLLPVIATLQRSEVLADWVDDLELNVPAGFLACTLESVLSLAFAPPGHPL